jgi:hypothetical protein
MKTYQEIKAEQIQEAIIAKGIEANFSVSNTDYGVSCYFTFYKNSESNEKLKIRISDHNVENYDRMVNELHVTDFHTAARVANAVELYLFPERFIFVEVKIGATHRINGVFGRYERI